MKSIQNFTSSGETAQRVQRASEASIGKRWRGGIGWDSKRYKIGAFTATSVAWITGIKKGKDYPCLDD